MNPSLTRGLLFFVGDWEIPSFDMNYGISDKIEIVSALTMIILVIIPYIFEWEFVNFNFFGDIIQNWVRVTPQLINTIFFGKLAYYFE